MYHFGVISRASLIKGSGFAELWPHLLALLAFAVVLMSVSVWRFRQQLSLIGETDSAMTRLLCIARWRTCAGVTAIGC